MVIFSTVETDRLFRLTFKKNKKKNFKLVVSLLDVFRFTTQIEYSKPPENVLVYAIIRVHRIREYRARKRSARIKWIPTYTPPVP